MNPKKLSIFTIGLFLSFFITSIHAYQVPFYNTNTSASTFYVNTPSLMPDGSLTCNVTLNAKTTLAYPTTFNMQWLYYSPFSSLLVSGSLEDTSNLTCQDLGSQTSSAQSVVGTYESRIKQISPASGYTDLQTIFSCTTGSDKVFFTSGRSDGYVSVDSNGESTGGYMIFKTGYNSLASTLAGYDNLCDGQFYGSLFAPSSNNTCLNYACSKTYLYPFNSSTAGKVNITASIANSTFTCHSTYGVTPHYRYDVKLVRMTDMAETSLFSFDDECEGTLTLNSEPIISANLTTLTPNTLYILAFHAMASYDGVSSEYMTTRMPDFLNISIDNYIPNYSCGNYTACVNSSQYRTCTDLNNISEDIIQIQACGAAVSGYGLLGFEQYIEQSVYECKKSWFTCAAYPTNQTIKVPVNWSVGFYTLNDSGTLVDAPRFIDMVNPPPDGNGIKSPEGSLSLLLWYVPANYDWPLQDIVANVSVVSCDNRSYGMIPSVTRDLNQSVFTDIIFPSTYSTLTMSVRKFTTPVEQYNTGNPFCVPSQLCYGVNCTEEPLGNYRVALLQLNATGYPVATLFEYYDVATVNWSRITFDMTSLGLIAGVNYRLVLSVVPTGNDVTSRRAVGVAWDNVSVNNLPESLDTVCAANEPQCDGINKLVPHFQGSVCTIETIINDSSCYQTSVVPEIPEINASVFEPIGGNATQTFFDSAGFSQASFFISPFFLFLAIFIAIGGYLDYKIGSRGLIFAIVMIIGFVIGSLPQVNIIPWWFTVLLTILAGGITVYFLSNMFRSQ